MWLVSRGCIYRDIVVGHCHIHFKTKQGKKRGNRVTQPAMRASVLLYYMHCQRWPRNTALVRLHAMDRKKAPFWSVRCILGENLWFYIFKDGYAYMKLNSSWGCGESTAPRRLVCLPESVHYPNVLIDYPWVPLSRAESPSQQVLVLHLLRVSVPTHDNTTSTYEGEGSVSGSVRCTATEKSNTQPSFKKKQNIPDKHI